MKRNPYKFRGPHTWALAKEAYLAGETAKSICERLDIGHSAMRRRMGKEGWTRRDHASAIDAVRVRRTPLKPEPPLPAPSAQPPADPPRGLTAVEAARWAVREAGRAMTEGRMDLAVQAVRTAEQLTRLLREHPELDPERTVPKAALRQLYTTDRSGLEQIAEEFGLTPEQAARVDWEVFVRADGSWGVRPPVEGWLPEAGAGGAGAS